MDNSWLFEETEGEAEADSDEEDNQTELEERLYAVVHHNDLSQPLPSELAKHYTLKCTDNGELEVTLNNSLEVVQLAESKQICNLLQTSNSNFDSIDQTNGIVSENKDDDVIFVDEIKKTINPKPTDNSLIQNSNVRKRFRYSDLTLDEFHGPEDKVESITNDFYYFDHDFGLLMKKKNRKFKNLKIPPPRSSSDWRIDSNANLGTRIGKDTVHSMTQALLEVNPHENKDKLYAFACVLFKRNVQLFKRKAKKERKKIRKLNWSVGNDSFNISKEIKDLGEKIQEYKSETVTRSDNNYKHNSEDNFNGSISLNISPFKPDHSMPDVVDLSSDTEDLTASSSKNGNENPSTTKNKNMHFPTKWTKEMIKFYSKRCKQELLKDIDDVVANLRRKSKAADWHLDPRDKTGNYQRFSPGTYKRMVGRCTNCNERGHVFENCDRPIKLPACTLCGELYHTDYSCPHKVCLKCGRFIMGDAFGGECNECYYTTFTGEEPCTICRELTHKSANCTDLWRSFHATTGGEKKIPNKVTVNPKKSCCNCGRKGHFSHDCPFIVYSGQQISCFVKNYSAEPLQRGSVDVIISRNYADIIHSNEADQFFHSLSDYTQAIIGVNDEGYEIVCKINGTIEQCKKAKLEIENYVNTRKRKRQEPTSKRKRQRVRF